MSRQDQWTLGLATLGAAMLAVMTLQSDLGVLFGVLGFTFFAAAGVLVVRAVPRWRLARRYREALRTIGPYRCLDGESRPIWDNYYKPWADEVKRAIPPKWVGWKVNFGIVNLDVQHSDEWNRIPRLIEQWQKELDELEKLMGAMP